VVALIPSFMADDCNENGVEDSVEVGALDFVKLGAYLTLVPPSDMQSADMDGDGDLDLVSLEEGYITVFKNKGQGQMVSGIVINTRGIPFEISNITISSDGNLSFDLNGIQDQSYLIEASADLFEWAELKRVGKYDGTIQVENIGASSMRFYRARHLP
jgi:hypothetical protein